MKKAKWFEILIIIVLCIVFSPVILFVLIINFFQNVVPAPFEYKKYKKSKFYDVYKKKYKIGITHDPHYLLQNELLEYNICLDEIRKPYGYMCLVNDYFCFALFDIEDLKLINDDLQIKLHDNSPYVSIEDFIQDERKYFEDECINRKFNILIWRENENEYRDILSNESNNLLLQNNGIHFYIETKELAKIVKEIILNKGKDK